MPQSTPEVVAHRGASADRAEHTRGAYELAMRQGADAVECDVRVSRDGQLVLVHDRRVDRTSSGSGVVSTLTVPAMSGWDFSSWQRRWPASADRLLCDPPSPERGVLTLPELLGMIRDFARPVRLFVETKHPVRYGGLVERLLAGELHRHGMLTAGEHDPSAVMMSFSSAAVRRFRGLAPTVPTVLLFEGGRRWRSGALPPWVDHAGPGIDVVRSDPGFVARAARHGHGTYCWTVDAPDDIALCRQAGVRYLATNAPAATRSHLNRLAPAERVAA
ncbi:glycerophosphodiester phosphodiesterase [Salinifilum aidingensis]